MTTDHRSPHPRRHPVSSAGEPTTVARPKRLLTQNSELKRLGIWNWSIPALAARLPDGQTIRTCPSAGVCAQVCYARAGRYNIPTVRNRHLANLRYVLEDPAGWEEAMLAELAAPRFDHRWVRIHDAGDFFSEAYLAAWLRIIRTRPLVNFYAYTKEIDLFRRLVERDPPGNFGWIYSYGGTQDPDLNPGTDRVADVFPTEEAIHGAGWHSQTASDLLAVTGPAPVGIPANNVASFRHRQGNRTFGQWQAQTQRRKRASDEHRPRRTARMSREHAAGHCARRTDRRPLQPDEPPTGACRHTTPAQQDTARDRTGGAEANP